MRGSAATACCHNPTGVDPTADSVSEICPVLSRVRGLIPMLDFAYQGFGDGLAEDCAGLHYSDGTTVSRRFVCSSLQQNFGVVTVSAAGCRRAGRTRRQRLLVVGERDQLQGHWCGATTATRRRHGGADLWLRYCGERRFDADVEKTNLKKCGLRIRS